MTPPHMVLPAAAGSGKSTTIPWLIFLALLLAASVAWAMTIGASQIGLAGVVSALLDQDGSPQKVVVTTVRLPRVVAGVLAGSALAVAGALMQAATNNPLASPGLLGVNSGAAFAIVLSSLLTSSANSQTYILFAFFGAGVAALLVYAIGSFGVQGVTPLKLALAGAILSTFLASLTSAVLIFDKATLDNVRVWSLGSLANKQLSAITTAGPYLCAGLVSAQVLSRQITTMSLGPDVARSVGQNLVLWRVLCGLMVVLLAGSAVAMCGPIGFVGLVIPHIARLLVGSDYRRIIPVSALAGALLLVLGDSLMRFFLPARDIPVGVTMAFVGAPFFIYLARSRLRVPS